MRVLCRDLDEWEACCDQVAAEGRTAPGSRGQPRSHPAVAQRMALEASIARALASLGLTPMARSQLGVNEVNRVSKLDAMIERRRRAEDAQRPRNGANGSR
jgi:P27 family predicted phage terminase small subunit